MPAAFAPAQFGAEARILVVAPSVAFMKTNFVPASRTCAQSICPCQRDTSMPCTGIVSAFDTPGWGLASLLRG